MVCYVDLHVFRLKKFIYLAALMQERLISQHVLQNKMSRCTKKSSKRHQNPVNTQISLATKPVFAVLIMQFIFSFWSFRINDYILRYRNGLICLESFLDLRWTLWTTFGFKLRITILFAFSTPYWICTGLKIAGIASNFKIAVYFLLLRSVPVIKCHSREFIIRNCTV